MIGEWRTDSKGRFAISGIPPLEWIDSMVLTTKSKTYRDISKLQIDLNQAENNIITLPVITLTQQVHPIKIKVVDQAGNPVKDAFIMAKEGLVMTTNHSSVTVLGKTDFRGEYSFKLSQRSVVIIAKKTLDNNLKLSGTAKVTGNLHDVTITMKRASP